MHVNKHTHQHKGKSYQRKKVRTQKIDLDSSRFLILRLSDTKCSITSLQNKIAKKILLTSVLEKKYVCMKYKNQ